MHLEYLEEFVNLSDSLNFTQTASHFFVSQPVLSRHISSLEHELGIQLFIRDKGRVYLTEYGKLFADDAKRVMHAYHLALQNINDMKNDIDATISVGYLLGAAGPFLPAIQESFMKRHPHVDVRYFSYEFNEIEEAFLNDKVDVVIAMMAGNSLEGRFDARPLYTDHFYAVLPKDHRLATRTEVGPSDLKGEDIVVPSHQFWQENAEGIRDYLQPVLGEVRIRSMLQDINSLPLLIETQGCIGIAMGHLQAYYRSDLVFVPLQDCLLDFPVGIVWRTGEENDVLNDYLESVVAVMNNAFK